MASKRVWTVLIATQLLAAVAVAQEVPLAEYGRANGGEIRIVTKNATSRFSGSLGLTTSTGLFGSGSHRGLDASVGGTLVEDRAWFFASAQQRESTLTSRFGTVPAGSDSQAIDARITAQLGDRNTLISSFRAAQESAVSTPAFTTVTPAPSSFLSLHYTGIVSSNMFFTGSVSRSKTSPSPWGLEPFTADGQ